MEHRAEAVQNLDLHAGCLARAAREHGLAVQILAVPAPGRPTAAKEWLLLEVDGRRYVYRSGVLRWAPGGPDGHAMKMRHINGAAAFITKDKSLAKVVLASAGVSVPVGAVFGRQEGWQARAYFNALRRPVCVKPNGGRKGILVFPDLRQPEAFEDAFRRAADAYAQVLVEESVEGEVVRYFYVAPRAVAMKLSLPANVVGDGARSIALLIAGKNDERAERAVPGHFPIAVDDDLRLFLAGQGLSLNSVPAPGARIMLRAISNGARGADSLACADTTHPSYATVVETACAALPGLKVAAIDMMVRDRSRPAAPGNHWILEINSSPGVLPYHFPWAGAPQDVSGAIIELIIRDSRMAA